VATLVACSPQKDDQSRYYDQIQKTFLHVLALQLKFRLGNRQCSIRRTGIAKIHWVDSAHRRHLFDLLIRMSENASNPRCHEERVRKIDWETNFAQDSRRCSVYIDRQVFARAAFQRTFNRESRFDVIARDCRFTRERK
jgi:hypothetical protein